MGTPGAKRPSFQFFPSCCTFEARHVNTASPILSFNSFPVAVGWLKLSDNIIIVAAFQFFPSCCSPSSPASRSMFTAILSILSQLLFDPSSSSANFSFTFQFFPSCCLVQRNQRASTSYS
ncbi:MAG: hypothetical protein NZ954_08735 [Thermofilaceae archaeon]|nr:hypothetical protein [Thermofilaceae archaeon]